MAKKEREIVHKNTRFNENPWKKEVQSEDVLKTMVAKKEASLGKVQISKVDTYHSFSKVVNFDLRLRTEGIEISFTFRT